jgi:hypothetical protein
MRGGHIVEIGTPALILKTMSQEEQEGIKT